MTTNDKQPLPNPFIRLLQWVHDRPSILLILLVPIIIILSHVGVAEITRYPAILISGGVLLVVGVHLLGGTAAIRAFRVWQQTIKSGDSEGSHVLRQASLYDKLVQIVLFGKEHHIRQQTIEAAQLNKGDTVLDVGCGTGNLALLAKSYVGETGLVYGTDASPEMIEMAQSKAKQAGTDVTFLVKPVQDSSFADDTFDVVLSSLMMHHLSDSVMQDGLSEIYRILKPEGRLLIVDIEADSNGSIFRKLSDVIVQLHGGHEAMKNNVTRLHPFLQQAQFEVLETGKINRQLAYILVQKNSVA